MAANVRSESALRMSDCVTELLRKQPFFGSLVLRLPLRADPTRKTLATDGQEIRYSPDWVAESDAHLIETAMARVVMACALKHHTRRAERDQERWQTASQVVTHALLRDAGFTLPPDAEGNPSVVPWNALPAGTVGACNSSFSAHSHPSPPSTCLGHHATTEGLLPKPGRT